jgi:hypothetical protein
MQRKTGSCRFKLCDSCDPSGQGGYNNKIIDPTPEKFCENTIKNSIFERSENSNRNLRHLKNIFSIHSLI